MRRAALCLFLLAPAAVRAADGVWVSSGIEFTPGMAPRALDLDNSGAVEILTNRHPAFAGMGVMSWNGGGWTLDPIENLVFGSGNALYRDPSGRRHALYGIATGLRYAQKSTGAWTMETVGSSLGEPSFGVDSQGRPHLVAGVGAGAQYFRKVAGVWTGTSVAAGGRYCRLVVSPEDEIIVACVDIGQPSNLTVQKFNGTNFTVLRTIPGLRNNGMTPGLAAGAGGLVHVAYLTQSTQAAYALISTGPPSAVLQTWTSTGAGYSAGMLLTLADGVPVIAPGKSEIFTGDGAGGFVGESFTAETAGVLDLKTGVDGRPYLIGSVAGAPALLAKLPAPAVASPAARTTTSITWGFSQPSNAIATGLRLRASDGADLSGPLPGNAATWGQTGLGVNAVQAVLAETYMPGFILTTSATHHTLAAPPRSLALSRTASGGVSAFWNANGNPPGTSYRMDLLSVDGSSATQTVTATNAAFAFSGAVPTALTLSAVSFEGFASPLSSLLSSSQTGGTWRASFDLLNGLRLDAAVAGPAGNLVLTAGAVDSFPSGSFSGAAPDPTPLGFLADSGEDLPANLTAVVTLRYPAGALNAWAPDSVLLYRYNGQSGLWVPLVTAHDAAARTLTARTDGWGVFRVMARTQTPAGLGNAAVYPNPFRPSSGAALTLRELPPGARVKVVTAAGRVVQEFTANAQGIMQWDGTDGRGGRVRSGVYSLRVESGGTERRFKILVEN